MNSDATADLTKAYREGPICLFTGAGVSFTRAKYYQTPGWWDLLLETCQAIHQCLGKDETRSRFEALRAKHQNPWTTADILVEEAGTEDRFVEKLRRVLVGRTGRDVKYGRLPMAYLKGASTLNAVIAFCSRLRAIRVNPCLVPNPHVRAVLTLNYDWFLEGGATQKYNANAFKPVSGPSSTQDEGKLAVYHIHGYLPHDISRTPRHQLILSSHSYQDAYMPGTFTVATLNRFLGRYATLFIGVSFADDLLLERLVHLARLGSTPDHFALVHEREAKPPLLRQLEDARVRAIRLSSFDDITHILGQLYCSALDDDDLMVAREARSGAQVDVEHLSHRRYWQKLLQNKH